MQENAKFGAAFWPGGKQCITAQRHWQALSIQAHLDCQHTVAFRQMVTKGAVEGAAQIARQSARWLGFRGDGGGACHLLFFNRVGNVEQAAARLVYRCINATGNGIVRLLEKLRRNR